jgi:hypothetical protein
MFKPLTYSTNVGEFTLGEVIRRIFSLSSHLQASNLGVIGRIGLDWHNIALTVVLTAWRRPPPFGPRFQIGRAQATISCPLAFNRWPKSQSSISERTNRRSAGTAETALFRGGGLTVFHADVRHDILSLPRVVIGYCDNQCISNLWQHITQELFATMGKSTPQNSPLSQLGKPQRLAILVPCLIQ